MLKKRDEILKIRKLIKRKRENIRISRRIVENRGKVDWLNERIDKLEDFEKKVMELGILGGKIKIGIRIGIVGNMDLNNREKIKKMIN